MPKTLVIGASHNPGRYANMAIRKLLAYKHEVEAISNREGEESGVKFKKPFPELKDIDTVTLYINPTIQQQYYDYLLSLKPRRVIFNPGTENEELERMLQKNNIEPVEACTLVMLSIGVY